MKFRDLAKVKEFKTINAKEFIVKNKPALALECTVIDIVGVPNLDLDFDANATPHVEVRCFLFDSLRKVAKSSIQIIGTTLVKGKVKQEPPVSSNWQISNFCRTLCMRGAEKWDLIIELVVYANKDKSK